MQVTFQTKIQDERLYPVLDAIAALFGRPDGTLRLRVPNALAGEYGLANGAQLGVFVDPDSQTVEVYRPGREPELHEKPSRVVLDPELPECVLELESVFEG